MEDLHNKNFDQASPTTPYMYNPRPNLVDIAPEVQERLKEFTFVTKMNPNELADMILTQWMDNQVALYETAWRITGRKWRNMIGKWKRRQQ